MTQQEATVSGTILAGGGLLLLWSSLAWAGVTEEEAVQEVQRIQLEVGERVLVGALGPEAERAFARQARMNSSLEIELVRIPTAGDRDRELTKSLERAGLRCGMWFAVDGDGWAIEAFGDCSPRIEAPAVEAAAPTAAPTAAVIVTDPEPDNAAVFARRALSLQETSSEAWSVLEGAERPLSAPTFATLIADPITEQTLAQEKRRANIAERSFRIGGYAVATSGLVSLIGMPSVSTPQGEDRVWTALFLGGTGLMAVLIAPRAIDGVAATQMELDRYYTSEQASEHIEVYNRALQTELGLLVEEVVEEEADEDILQDLLEPEQLSTERGDTPPGPAPADETSEAPADETPEAPADETSSAPEPEEAPQ